MEKHLKTWAIGMGITLLAALSACDLGSPEPVENNTALTLSTPTNNQTVYNPLDISGTCYDQRNVTSIRVYCSPVTLDSTNSVEASYSGAVLLPFNAVMTNTTQGFYYLWAVAVNQDNQVTVSPKILVNNQGNTPNTNLYDFVPPLIQILSHTNLQTVSASFDISGSASDNKSGVKDIWLTVDGGTYRKVWYSAGSWQTNLTLLTEGNHTISSYAVDYSNNISLTNSIVVNFLASLPSISIQTPVSMTLFDDETISVSGTATVSSGTISSVAVKINNSSYTSATYNSGTLGWSLNGVTLDLQGTNVLFVRAVSSTLVTNIVSVKVLLDTGTPTADLVSPADNAVLRTSSISVSGTASDSTTWITNVKVGLDGSYINASGTSSWSATVSAGDGTHTLSVYAIDAAGNSSAVDSITITVDTTAPTLNVNTPPANVESSDLVLSGTASDSTSGLEGIYIKLNNGSFSKALGGSSWSNSLTLINGANTIRVYAQDNAGNRTSTNSYTVTKATAQSLTVHFKLPAGWNAPSVYFYQAVPTNVTTTWATAPAMTNEGNGWYTITLNAQKLRVIFKDGTRQYPPSGESGMLITNHIENYFWTNNHWYSKNPEAPVDLSCAILSPANNSLTVQSNITVTGNAYAVDSLTAVYISINGGSFTPASGTSTWTYATALVMGTNTIRAFATGNGGNSSETNTVKVIRRLGGNNPYPGTWSGRKGAWLYSDGVEFSTFWRTAAADKVYVAGDFSSWQLKPLTNIGNNTWVGFVAGVQAGANYKLVGIKTIDNVTTTNWIQDIYGAYTHGDLGNSIVVDHTEFTWQDGDWSRPSWDYYSIYEMNVYEFTATDTSIPADKRGTYLGVAEKMQYLADLGITCIELMPIAEFGGNEPGWGYDSAVFTSPESSYGSQPFIGYQTINEFKTLINEAHKHGIAVVLDVVFNHTGGANPFWFMDRVLYFDWNNDGLVQANPGQPDNSPWGNHFCNWKTEVQTYSKEVLEYWITEYHIDGFRYDAANTDYIVDNFINNMKSYLEPKYPNLITLVESLPPQNAHKMKGPQWNLPYYKNAREVLKGVGTVNQANPGGYDNYGFSMMDNIDVSYMDTAWGYSTSAWHVVNYMDSHDEKSVAAYLINAGLGSSVPWKSRLAIATLIASKGFPMIYSGQEFGNDRDTPDEGQPGRTDLRPMDWSTYTANKNTVYDYYAGMFNLRKNHASLRNLNNRAQLIYGATDNCVGYRFEKSGSATFVIYLNYGGDKNSFSLNSLGAGTWKLVAGPDTFYGESSVITKTQWDTINLNGSSALVFMLQ